MTRNLAAGSLGLALAAALATGASAKTLVYCSEGSPEGFNPSLYTAGTTFDAISRALYNRLVEFELGTTEIVPALAESWEISDDGLQYTFHLRPGVKFHTTDDFTPSRDFNADDVLYSFQRQLDPEHPYHQVSGGTYEYFQGMNMPNLLKAVEKVDDMTVRFVLNEPEAPFLANMAMDFASILSAEYADQMLEAGSPETVDLNPVGTGPFQLVNYQKDAVIRYKANPDYWAGKAAIDDLVFAITIDPAVRWQKLQAGECHVMPYPNPADLEAMRNHPDIQVLEQEGLNVGYLAFNTEKEPFTDKRVRQALNMAIDKEAILDAVFQGAGRDRQEPDPADHVVVQRRGRGLSLRSGRRQGAARGGGRERAADRHLGDAGAAAVQPECPAHGRADPGGLGERRGRGRDRLASNGASIWSARKNGEHQTVLLGWTGDNGDPDNFLYVLLGCAAADDGTNRARWCHEPFNDLLVEAKRTSDVAERTRLYEEAQVIFKEEAPWVTVAHSIVFMPMRKEVVGYKIDPFGGHIFYGVDLES